ncbi:hypothetical protein Tco_1104672 [Tanacetum coccineum]
MVLLSLAFYLLLVVIVVMVMIVVVILVVVVVAIIVVVVVIVGSSVPFYQQTFGLVERWFLLSCHTAPAVTACVLDLLLVISKYFAILDIRASRASVTDLSERKIIFEEKGTSRASNNGDSDNTRDGGKTAGRAIITWGGGMVSYVCIYGSSCKGGKNSMSKRYLVKSSEELG